MLFAACCKFSYGAFIRLYISLQEENDEQITGKFYNSLYSLELEKGKWFEVELRYVHFGQIKNKCVSGNGSENQKIYFDAF